MRLTLITIICDCPGCENTLSIQYPESQVDHKVLDAGWKINPVKNLHFCPECSEKPEIKPFLEYEKNLKKSEKKT